MLWLPPQTSDSWQGKKKTKKHQGRKNELIDLHAITAKNVEKNSYDNNYFSNRNPHGGSN